MRIVINPYGISNSAKELANYIGVKRLKVNGSRFIGKNRDTVINWGNGKGNVGNARQINKLSNVQLASNKLQTFDALREAWVKTPTFFRTVSSFPNGTKLLARTDLYGHSGRGIEVFDKVPETLYPQAPLYVEYIEKKYEYRVIAVGDSAVDTKQKKKRSSPRDTDGNVIEDTRIEHDEHVWNLDGGYIFARENIRQPDGLNELAVSAIKALGLDFGAVDIIEDAEGTLYVLEVNTAFGLEGTTIQLVGDAIKELL